MGATEAAGLGEMGGELVIAGMWIPAFAGMTVKGGVEFQGEAKNRKSQGTANVGIGKDSRFRLSPE